MLVNKKISHVIFDLDGLLIDTEKVYTECTQKMVDKYANGKVFTWDLKAKLMGKKETEAVKILIDALELPISVEDYQMGVKHLYEEEFPKVSVLPGVDRLLRHLYEHNIPMCIATGSDTGSYRLKAARHKDLFGLLSHVVLSGDDPDVMYAKPAPDCFLVAAARFSDNPDPQEVLVFEDAPNGVMAAHAAKMPVVWIPPPPLRDSGVGDISTLILNSMEEFIPEEFGLPSYKNV